MSIQYKLLGTGTYGYVITPNVTLKTDPISKINTNIATKLFKNRDDCITEYENNRKIDVIDPNYDWHLRMEELKYFRIQTDKIRNPYIENLSKMIKEMDKIYCINYELGGVNIMQFFNNHNNGAEEKPLDIYLYQHFMREILSIMQIIKLMQENKYIHHDLRITNILVCTNYKLKLIDFGLMEYMPDYLDYCEDVKEDKPRELFEFFPLEWEYYNINRFNNYIEYSKKRMYYSKMLYLKRQYSAYFIDNWKTFEDKYLFMIDNMHTITHKEFLEKSFYTFDIYSLSTVLLFINETFTIKRQKRFYNEFDEDTEIIRIIHPKWKNYESLYQIIDKMITPNLFGRVLIEPLIMEFNEYIEHIGVIDHNGVV